MQPRVRRFNNFSGATRSGATDVHLTVHSARLPCQPDGRSWPPSLSNLFGCCRGWEQQPRNDWVRRSTEMLVTRRHARADTLLIFHLTNQTVKLVLPVDPDPAHRSQPSESDAGSPSGRGIDSDSADGLPIAAEGLSEAPLKFRGSGAYRCKLPSYDEEIEPCLEELTCAAVDGKILVLRVIMLHGKLQSQNE